MENVSRAALKLHVTQPALTQQIRDLEDEIGFSLLDRTAKSVRLTDAGRAYLDNARALLRNAGEAVTKARAVASAEPTELHVGYSAENTVEILPKTLRAFQQAMPNVHVRLHDWNNKDMVDGIRDGRLQLGLIVPPAKASALHDLRYEELFHERVRVAVEAIIKHTGATSEKKSASATSQTMKAIRIHNYGGPEVLEYDGRSEYNA